MTDENESIIARASVPNANGDVFSSEALEQMRDQINRRPPIMTHNFNARRPIGIVKEAKIENGALYIRAKLAHDVKAIRACLSAGTFLVRLACIPVEYYRRKRKGVKVLKRVDVTEVSITPADKQER